MSQAVRDFSVPSVRAQWLQELLGLADEPGDAAWSKMAVELFTWHYQTIPSYRRLCRSYQIDPTNLAKWDMIPAVPQQLFKQEQIYAWQGEPGTVYETSGSTTGTPGKQNLWSTDVYRGVALAGAAFSGLDPYSTVDQLHFLAPSPTEAPRSSLSAMFGFWADDHPSNRSSQPPQFWVKDGVVDAFGFRMALEKEVLRKRKVGICGTAFHFVHILDAWRGLPPLDLPKGSWVLETGGFKGRSREIPKPELYTEISRAFILEQGSIWNEYGMSELSSQAYAQGEEGLHRTPPWARVLIIDPLTNRPVPPGKEGLVRWLDLANIDSLLAVQTLDVAVPTLSTDSFKLIGRLPAIEPRGCSLQAEELNVS